MDRSSYAYAPLSLSQYEAIVTASEMAGNTSPMHGEANWRAADAAAQAGNVDLRVLLAGTHFEDHDGTDPNGGIALAKVQNYGGIIFAGQPGAFRSDILRPLNERRGDPEGKEDSSHYAGFHDFGGFVAELIRTLNNQYIGPAFTSGDLARAWGIYIGGPDNPNMAGGQARVEQWQYYRDRYKPEGATNVVTGADIIAKARTYVGQPNSDGIDGNTPWNHPWAFWCESFTESIPRSLGLPIPRYVSAVAHGRSIDLNVADPPENGAWVFMDERFFAPDGHVFFWDAERGQALGTVTDGKGVGYRNWGPQTFGYMGWAMPDGAGEAVAPVIPVVSGNLVIPGNPYNAGRVAPNEIGLGGGIRALWESMHEETRMVVLGFPMTNEYDGFLCTPVGGGRFMVAHVVVQDFERNRVIYQASAPDGQKVRVPLRSELCGPADDPAVNAVISNQDAQAK